MGPTAISALVTLQAAKGVWQRAVLLSFTSGIIQLFMGVFGLGFVVDFVSGPVCSGFTSAVALIVFTSQVKDIFGKIFESFALYFKLLFSGHTNSSNRSQILAAVTTFCYQKCRSFNDLYAARNNNTN